MIFEILDNHFRHPWIIAILATSALLLLAGVVAEIVLTPLWAAFFGVYSVIVLLVAVFWFVGSKSIQFVSNRNQKQFN